MTPKEPSIHLENLKGLQLLDLITDNKLLPMVCLFSLDPIEGWVREYTASYTDCSIVFKCGPACKHPPFVIKLPVKSTDQWVDIQTFKMPDVEVGKLVEEVLGKVRFTKFQAYGFKDRVRYWAKIVKAELDQLAKVVPG